MINKEQCRKKNIRVKHSRKWREYKKKRAPDSQIHHEWIPGTVNYNGYALVDADKHMHGHIDVIEILYGKITRFTEEDVARADQITK